MLAAALQVRTRKAPAFEGGAEIVEVAFFVSHGDQPPVAVSGGKY
jgi:hypothetical protein